MAHRPGAVSLLVSHPPCCEDSGDWRFWQAWLSDRDGAVYECPGCGASWYVVDVREMLAW